MSLVKRNKNPFFLEDFFNNDWFGGISHNTNRQIGYSVPAVNVKEDENEFAIELAAPGMKKADFSIELDNDILTISSEQKQESENKDEKGNYTRREFSYSSFKRSFTLPDSVEYGNINAEYKDGLLHVTLPKKEESKQQAKRLIEIS